MKYVISWSVNLTNHAKLSIYDDSEHFLTVFTNQNSAATANHENVLGALEWRHMRVMVSFKSLTTTLLVHHQGRDAVIKLFVWSPKQMQIFYKYFTPFHIGWVERDYFRWWKYSNLKELPSIHETKEYQPFHSHRTLRRMGRVKHKASSHFYCMSPLDIDIWPYRLLMMLEACVM